MYTIGEFSRIGHVSKKMLRHYDTIGLLIPDKVNDENGYRYYSHAQAIKMIRINKLKEYKFSLKEILEILNEDNDEVYLTAIKDKMDEINHEMESLHSVLSQMKNEVKTMKKGTSMFTKRTFDIIEDYVDEFNYISVRKMVAVIDTGEMYESCYSQMYANGLEPIGPSYSMYHDEDFNVENSDIEICIPVNRKVDGVTKKQNELRAIRTEFIGPFTEISEAYAALFDYANKKNLLVLQPTYEKYIKGPGNNVKPEAYITEIIFEVTDKE